MILIYFSIVFEKKLFLKDRGIDHCLSLKDPYLFFSKSFRKKKISSKIVKKVSLYESAITFSKTSRNVAKKIQ